MIKPKRLEKGDTIGVISPASPSEKKSDILRGTEYLESLGYKVVVGKNVNKTKGFVAASEEERAADFNEMFRRDDIDAVFVTQGGYGSAQIIHLIDFEAVRKNPKILTGFSDITSLHLAIHKKTGVITFHGPGMSRFNPKELTDYTKEHFFKALSSADPVGEIRLADNKAWLHSIGPGTAEGDLIGGNLTLVCASLGTPYEIDTKDRILLIEDVETEPWIFDHNLSHLRNAGKLKDVKGIVVGDSESCVPFKHNPGFFSDTSLEDVLEYYLKPLGIPVLYGLPLGHTKDLATLPMGVRVRLDADNKTFTVLESGVL
ncbi:S66 peptidase family protein [Gudongella sp. SC589]|uniref:S66 peptidase family protein n=1 Tax=Gudongella sp. SC589 TaxID=3385990 RepID=UPI0039049E5F